MIPVYRTRHMESAANLLLKFFKTVLVYCAYTNVHKGRDLRVRFRADKVRDPRVFFDKTASQVKRWHERGGVLIVWNHETDDYPEHDAILFAEAPRRIETIIEAAKRSRRCAVIYEPTSWKAHEEICSIRHAEHAAKRRRALRDLAIMQHYMEQLPLLSRLSLERRSRARSESSRSSSARGSRADVAPLAGTPG